jgi:hypothetical protein
MDSFVLDDFEGNIRMLQSDCRTQKTGQRNRPRIGRVAVCIGQVAVGTICIARHRRRRYAANTRARCKHFHQPTNSSNGTVDAKQCVGHNDAVVAVIVIARRLHAHVGVHIHRRLFRSSSGYSVLGDGTSIQ